MRTRLTLKLLPLTILGLLMLAPAAFATNNDGRGFYGATNDKVVTNAGFILIVFLRSEAAAAHNPGPAHARPRGVRHEQRRPGVLRRDQRQGRDQRGVHPDRVLEIGSCCRPQSWACSCSPPRRSPRTTTAGGSTARPTTRS